MLEKTENPLSSNWEALKSSIGNGSSSSKKRRNRAKKHKRNATASESSEPSKKHMKKDEIWFDGVDESLIKESMQDQKPQTTTDTKLVKENSTKEMTKSLAIDCEMVGVGYQGKTSVLARVSLVNLYGHCVYDKFVKPQEEVTDYRTEFSGIRPENLVDGEDFKTVQKDVYEMIKDRILVGHAVHHDLKVLYLSHPKSMIRDTSMYFQKYHGFSRPKLRLLAERYLMVKIQEGEHDSVIDAQATMRLYTLFKTHWETKMSKFLNKQKRKHGNHKGSSKETTTIKQRFSDKV